MPNIPQHFLFHNFINTLVIYSRSLHSSHPVHPSPTQTLPCVTSCFGKLFYSFRFIIHRWWFYYSYYNLLMYYLFVNHACLTLPAASGGHSWKVGGWAGCSSGCHWGPKVAPPDGQCGKDSCGHPWRSSGEKPVLSQADIHIGWTLNFLVKEKLSMHLFYIFPYEVCIIQK